MKSTPFLKAMLLLCSSFLWLSCSSWEEVVAPAEFVPLKITSVSPNTNVYVGDTIIITGENFIEKKEYNQVWFGGAVRGIVDSATATKLFLKVPKGAKTGMLSVSNGIYADTLESNFEVLKKTTKLTYKLGRIKILEKKTYTSYSHSGGGSYHNVDTSSSIKELRDSTTIIRGLPARNWDGTSCYKPLPDSIFQTFFFQSPIIYKTVEYNIDSVLGIFRYIVVSHHAYDRYKVDDNHSGEYCKKIILKLENVPYTLKDETFIINLTGNTIQQYITNYEIKSKEVIRKSWGFSEGTEDEIEIKNFKEILPDAHFELTLE
jgi:hypothetical protein